MFRVLSLGTRAGTTCAPRVRDARETRTRAVSASPLERASGVGFLTAVTTPDSSDPERPAAAPPAGGAFGEPAAPPGGRTGDAVLRLAVRCGLFAAAATAGAIVGFAIGAGDGATTPFAMSGRMLLGVAASDGLMARAVAVAAGVLLHCGVVVAWAVPFVAIARRRHGAVLLVTAALYAAAIYVASERLLPPLLRLGHGVRAFPPQVVLLHAVLAAALGAGMRIAFSGNASPPAASHQ